MVGLAIAVCVLLGGLLAAFTVGRYPVGPEAMRWTPIATPESIALQRRDS